MAVEVPASTTTTKIAAEGKMNWRKIACLIVLSGASCVGMAQEWHGNLYLPGELYWRKRIPIDIVNASGVGFAGRPVPVKIGKQKGELDLVGVRVRELRLCDAEGNEFLFGLETADGALVREGSVNEGMRLIVPVECEPKERKRYYVYYDNPTAWAVPEFFEVTVGIRNGGMEAGAEAPSGWRYDRGDEQHAVSRVQENPHSGKWCLKTVVAEGAEPTWIAARQRGISITGGAHYVLRGWVKAENVKGKAGWYIHVGNEENPMLMGPVIDGGDGTYDWKEVRFEFTAPPEANTASVGTVLRGTGTAWHDDVVLECTRKPPAEVEIGEPQDAGLKVTGKDAPWPGSAEGDYRWRLPVYAVNLGDRTKDNVLVSVGLGILKARLRDRLNLGSLRVAGPAGKLLPHSLAGDELVFIGSLPAKAISVYHVYFSGDPNAKGGPVLDYDGLLQSKANLARNPSFEEGDALPAEWLAGREGDPKPPQNMARVNGGRVGSFCAKLTVPAGAPLGWVGWRQEVPAGPNTTYWYGAYVKTQDITDGKVGLHGHFHDAKGELCELRKYFGTGQKLEGTNDWTLLKTVVRTPSDLASVELHLTMHARGTIWHDGVLFCETVPARTGRIEVRPSGKARDLAVWAVNPIVKVFQDDPPQEEPRELRIFAARNEKEPLQLVLRSSAGLKSVQVLVEPLANDRGEKPLNITVNRVGYVPIDHPTAYYGTKLPTWRRRVPTHRGRSDGWQGYWPDPLLPEGAFDLAPGTAQPVWITAAVPKDAAAGDYAGKVTIRASGKTVKTIPLRVTVWDFALPDESHVIAIYDLRRGRGWDFPDDENRRAWCRMMAEHRTSPGILGAKVKFEYKDGRASLDTEEFDKWASYCLDELKINALYTPWQFYCFGWGHPPRRFLGFEPFTPEYKKAYQACLRAFWDHLKRKGWDKKFILYISDEPHYRDDGIIEQMQKLCDMIHEAVPEAKIYSSTWRHVPEWNGYLDIWGVGAYGCFPVEEMEARLKAGEELWFTTDGQMCTDTPYCAIERLYPYYCWKYGAGAYEFWGVSWWTYDPFKFGWHSFIRSSPKPGEFRWVRYPNGDGFLTYPGWLVGAEGPLSSVRFEQAREGVEDYEYFYLLKQRIEAAKKKGKDTASAEAALEKVKGLVTIPNAGGLRSTEILPDPDAVFEIRRRAAEEIVKLGK